MRRRRVMRHLGGFNGAPAHQPGRLAHRPVVLRGAMLASMEPQLISRGDPVSRSRRFFAGRCFNGAPAHQPGRQPPEPRGRACRSCFNGAPAHQPGRPGVLSWRLPVVSASMEPQLISRGDPRRPRRVRGRSVASMEPQLISRGDLLRPFSREASHLRLQWSPSSSAGETHRAPPREHLAARLQWSPSSSAGETKSQGSQTSRGTPSFNGAPAHQPGRPIGTTARSGGSGCFNGAPAHQPGRLVSESSSRAARNARFNGAPAHQPGRPSRTRKDCATEPEALQWSPSSSAGET